VLLQSRQTTNENQTKENQLVTAAKREHIANIWLPPYFVRTNMVHCQHIGCHRAAIVRYSSANSIGMQHDNISIRRIPDHYQLPLLILYTPSRTAPVAMPQGRQAVRQSDEKTVKSCMGSERELRIGVCIRQHHLDYTYIQCAHIVHDRRTALVVHSLALPCLMPSAAIQEKKQRQQECSRGLARFRQLLQRRGKSILRTDKASDIHATNL